jgi:hypothetical protein
MGVVRIESIIAITAFFNTFVCFVQAAAYASIHREGTVVKFAKRETSFKIENSLLKMIPIKIC